RWAVPIVVRNGNHIDTILLDADTTRLPLTDRDAPVVVNAGGHGFYRVAYDDELTRRLTGARASLDTLERYLLVDDAWNAVVAGRSTAPEFLSLLDGFREERNLAVWQAISIGLRGLARLLDDEDMAAFQRHVVA